MKAKIDRLREERNRQQVMGEKQDNQLQKLKVIRKGTKEV